LAMAELNSESMGTMTCCAGKPNALAKSSMASMEVPSTSV